MLATPPPNFSIYAYLPSLNATPELKVWLGERKGRHYVHEVVIYYELRPIRDERDQAAARLAAEKALFGFLAGLSAEHVRRVSDELATQEYRERNA